MIFLTSQRTKTYKDFQQIQVIDKLILMCGSAHTQTQHVAAAVKFLDQNMRTRDGQTGPNIFLHLSNKSKTSLSFIQFSCQNCINQNIQQQEQLVLLRFVLLNQSTHAYHAKAYTDSKCTPGPQVSNVLQL